MKPTFPTILGLLLIASLAHAFPFWLESPKRDNPRDPRAFTFQPATDTPVPTATATAVPRGANLPFDEYEAEDVAYNGTLIGPGRAFGSFESESSQRQAVRLNSTGEFVSLNAGNAFNSIVVRYIIPDAPGGGGINATLSLYVGGVEIADLDLTSRFAWIYGGEADSSDNNPASGGAHHFYDEVRLLFADFPAGTEVRLQRDAGDTAAYYVIDLIDLEQVAPPLTMPGGFVSITSYGAIAGDGLDDRPAIQAAYDAAEAGGLGLWIPAGDFDLLTPHASNSGLRVDGVTIRGAGMWHSNLRGQYARFRVSGNNCRFYDFSILGDTTTRNDSIPDNGFNGRAGTGSWMENVWVEHTKVAWWVGSTSYGFPTDGLTIRGCRFRNLFADGVNFCNGTSNSVIEQTHVRNSGDDAMASWAINSTAEVNTGNVFRNNTVQLPWRANCFAIYGGNSNRIEDNVCADTVLYPGIYLAQEFGSWAFSGSTQVRRNDLIRAGGRMWSKNYGAFKINAIESNVAGFVVEDLMVVEPTYSGIHFEGPFSINSVQITNATVQSAGTYGIEVSGATAGSATFADTSIVSPTLLPTFVPGASTFNLVDGGGNTGW